MKTINYNELTFNDESFSKGSFGKIRECMYDGKTYALKSFFDDKYLKSKKMKLNKLSSINNPHLLTPKFWVQENGKKNKYLTEYCFGKDIDSYSEVDDITYKIKILESAKLAVSNMHKEGIIHSDLIGSNIMIENDTAKIIDFDNCNFLNYKPNIYNTNDFTYDFINNYGICEELDIYIFNILTFSIINNIDFYLVREAIYQKNYGYFVDSEQKKICDSLLFQKSTLNKDFLIDTITKK